MLSGTQCLWRRRPCAWQPRRNLYRKKQIFYKVLNFFYWHWQWCCHPGDVYRNKNGDSLLHSFDKILVAKNAQLGLIYYTFNCMDITFIQCHWVPENKYQDFWIHRSPVIVRLAEENVSGKHKWMVPTQDATRCLESSDLNVFLTMLDISGLGMNAIIGLLLKMCLDKKNGSVFAIHNNNKPLAKNIWHTFFY